MWTISILAIAVVAVDEGRRFRAVHALVSLASAEVWVHTVHCTHRRAISHLVAIRERAVRNRWFSVMHIVAENEMELFIKECSELISVTFNSPPHSCKCSSCMDLGTMIHQRRRAFRQLCSLARHSPSMRSSQFVALNGKAREDSYKLTQKINSSQNSTLSSLCKLTRNCSANRMQRVASRRECQDCRRWFLPMSSFWSPWVELRWNEQLDPHFHTWERSLVWINELINNIS